MLQLLEGDETAVRDTYLRIRRDPRHFACVVISEATIPARQFDQWDMGLVRPGDAGDEQPGDPGGAIVAAGNGQHRFDERVVDRDA